MKIIILGSSGLLGSYLYKLGKQKGLEVLGISRTKSVSTDVICDATDEKALESVLKEEGCDALINAIKFKGSTDECENNKEECWKINFSLPISLASLQQKYGFMLVHISTDWVFEGIEGTIYKEDSIPYPQNFYAFSKYASELALSSKSTKFLILRTTGLFGFEQPPRNFFARVLDAAKSGKQFDAASDQYSQPISALELSEIIYSLLEKKISNRILHAVGSEYISRYEFAQKIVAHFGFDKGLVKSTTSTMRSITVPKYLKLDISLTEYLLGRKIPSLEHMMLDLEKDAGVQKQ